MPKEIKLFVISCVDKLRGGEEKERMKHPNVHPSVSLMRHFSEFSCCCSGPDKTMPAFYFWSAWPLPGQGGRSAAEPPEGVTETGTEWGTASLTAPKGHEASSILPPQARLSLSDWWTSAGNNQQSTINWGLKVVTSWIPVHPRKALTIYSRNHHSLVTRLLPLQASSRDESLLQKRVLYSHE